MEKPGQEKPPLALQIDYIIDSVFEPYLQFFTLLLVGRFALNMHDYQIKDHFLNEKVPFAVFIQNCKIYKKTTVYEIRRDANTKKQVREQIGRVQIRHENQLSSGIKIT